MESFARDLESYLAGEPPALEKVHGHEGLTTLRERPSPSGTIRALRQIPPPPADFTGREAELAETLEQGGVTISGLQGMGGVGKTALALKLAEELAARYADAQIYLDLKGGSREPLTPAQAMSHVIRSFHPQAPLPTCSRPEAFRASSPRASKLCRLTTPSPCCGASCLAAAAAIWKTNPESAENLLGELVKNGLVGWDDGRYRLHDLARFFGERRMSGSECFAVQQRHAAHYLVLRTAEGLYWEGGKSMESALHLFDTEWHNIRAGQAWSEAHSEENSAIARLCSDYPQAGSECLWMRLSDPTVVHWLERALAATPIAPSSFVSRLSRYLGI